MMYHIFFWMMMVGFGGCSFYAGDLRTKLLGGLLVIVNFIMFYGR